MDIGKHQRVAGGPEHGAVGEEDEFLSRETDAPRSFRNA
jgi:hypothetical protein